MRVWPYVVFAGLASLQGHLGFASAYWVYGLRTLLGAWLVWAIWPVVREMRWAWSLEAIGAGVVVFVLWVGLDPYYPKITVGLTRWNPLADLGQDSTWAWGFILLRWAGSTLVVPPLEEVFFRSFLYRYLVKPEFSDLPLNTWRPLAFVFTAGIFALVHSQWLAGFLCGLIYQWLVLRKGRLGDAMTAHAVTNFLLGGWVLWRGAWGFW